MTAFLIVGITGIPYATIVVAALLPAIVFYAYLALVVHFRARCRSLVGTGPESELPDVLPVRRALREYGHLLLSLAVLVYLLAIREPPPPAAAYAILAVFATELVKGLWRAGLRDALDRAGHGLAEGALLGVTLAIILTTIGILTDIVVITGFAQKLSFLILNMAQGSRFILLVLSAIASLVFGLGLPTPAAYVLVALFGVPALLDAGTPLLHAHLFVFYFANISAITPPVALAPLVASKIAGSGYFKTSIVALQLGVPGCVLPFLFVYTPELLIRGSLGPRQIALAGAAVAAVVTLNAASTGNFFWPLARWQRFAFFLGSLGFLSLDLRLAALATIAIGLVVGASKRRLEERTETS